MKDRCFITRVNNVGIVLFWTGKKWIVSNKPVKSTKIYSEFKHALKAKSQLLRNHPEFRIKINEA